MRWNLFRSLLVLLAVLGLVLAPIAGPVGATPAQPAMNMAADMPCPHKAPDAKKPCCAEMMISCAMGCGPSPSMAGDVEAAPGLTGTACLILPKDDLEPAGLSPSPPIRPPRA